MVDEEIKSDLIDIVHHEHDHLRRLFQDISTSFEAVAGGEVELKDKREELDTAAEDLSVALEEMLHHFTQEEEVFFVDLERRFPELSDDIEELTAAHEAMCERTQWLQQQLSADIDEMADNVGDILDVLDEMVKRLEEHTAEENRIFGLALQRMPREEQDELLDEMRKI